MQHEAPIVVPNYRTQSPPGRQDPKNETCAYCGKQGHGKNTALQTRKNECPAEHITLNQFDAAKENPNRARMVASNVLKMQSSTCSAP